MHSCGNIMTRIDDLMDIGLDGLNPLEIKAGMEPFTLKEKYGDKLTLHGGINAVLWDDKEAVIEEIRRCVPTLKQNGGYIFSSDHSIPNSVSLENFRAIIEEVKRVGKY
jgi:uroporphyrinogen decarboxylase